MKSESIKALLKIVRTENEEMENMTFQNHLNKIA